MAEFDCCYIYLITYVHFLLHSPILLDLIGIKLLLYSDSFVGIKPEVTSLNRPNNQMYSEVYSVYVLHSMYCAGGYSYSYRYRTIKLLITAVD